MNRDNRIPTKIISVALLLAALLAPLVAAAQPTISIYTDKADYGPQETIEVSLSANNLDAAATSDVYVGLIRPDGSVYTLQEDGWCLGIRPWMEGTYLPAGFVFERSALWWFGIPWDSPPIGDEGRYHFAAGLAHPGGIDFVSLDLTPFNVRTRIGSHYYVDGGAGSDSNDGSLGSPWKTIVHALSIVNGSFEVPATIHVAAGTYSASTNGETFPLVMKEFVSLEGAGAELTILDAERAAYHVICCEKVYELVTIERFTITGGNADGEFWPDLTADACGGGVFCLDAGPTIRESIITGNDAQVGGGLYCYWGCPTVENNLITGNGFNEGSGIFCCEANALIDGNSITENIGAGAMHCYEDFSVIQNNMILNNSSNGSSAGISCAGGGTAILNNLVANNMGRGVFVSDASFPIVENCTIAFNTSEGDGHGSLGAGIYASDSGLTVYNSIIWGNGSDIYGCAIDHCCIEDSNAGNGVIHDNPFFVSGPCGDFYLDYASRCIDAGAWSADEAGLSGRTTQVDGTPDSGVVDIGFHYPISQE